MPYIKGKPFYPEEKRLLVSVKQYFDRNRAVSGVKESSEAVKKSTYKNPQIIYRGKKIPD